ncbi:MAG: outer membrane beta-barrel domain-containing protein [Bradymonadia bacterium]
MKGNRNRKTTALAALLCASLPTMGWAAGITGPKKSALEKLEAGAAIRDRVQYRGGRFHVAPAFGFTLNDPFQRNILFGGQLGYHLTDSFGIGATVLAGTPMNTGLADTIESERPERAKGGFSNVSLLGTLDIEYVPLAGKLALFGRTVMNYDLHVLAGVGGAKISGDGSLDKFAITPVAGVGMRTYVQKWLDVNIELRDYLYSSALNAVRDTDVDTSAPKSSADFSNNFALTIGVGFSFPQEPEVTR